MPTVNVSNRELHSVVVGLRKLATEYDRLGEPVWVAELGRLADRLWAKREMKKRRVLEDKPTS